MWRVKTLYVHYEDQVELMRECMDLLIRTAEMVCEATGGAYWRELHDYGRTRHVVVDDVVAHKLNEYVDECERGLRLRTMSGADAMERAQVLVREIVLLGTPRMNTTASVGLVRRLTDGKT